MIVYYVAASPQIVENRRRYGAAKHAIKATGALLAPDYSWESQYEMSHAILDEEDYDVMFNLETTTLDKSDVLIADATNKSTFGVGYYVARMLGNNKPVLLLLHKTSQGGSVISGLKHPRITREHYTDTNMADIIERYLAEVQK